MREAVIIPDILTDSLEVLVEKLQIVVELTDRVHIDVIDGVFADNKTLMPENLNKIRWGDLRVDVQLMVDDPAQFVDNLRWSDRVFGHVERLIDKSNFLAQCEAVGVQPGWGVNLETTLDEVGEEWFERVGAVMLMSVPVGFSGQEFDESVLAKIHELRGRGFGGDIVVDGGMNLETIPLALKAGANQFAVNSGLWQTDDVIERYQLLTGLVE